MPYQYFKNIFHEHSNKNLPKISVEPQTTLNSQSNMKQKEQR